VTAFIDNNPTPTRIVVGEPTNTSGTLFMIITPEADPLRWCSRSMKAADNVIIDVRSCVTDVRANLASKIIAETIAHTVTG
jgi:hypothetical protein